MPMVPEGGTFVVPVRINDQITLKFVIDSGASDVSVPADVVMTLAAHWHDHRCGFSRRAKISNGGRFNRSFAAVRDPLAQGWRPDAE